MSVIELRPRGFTRGAIVREIGGGPNMLVMRQVGDDVTACIVIESDTPGAIRVREFSTAALEQMLPASGQPVRGRDV